MKPVCEVRTAITQMMTQLIPESSHPVHTRRPSRIVETTDSTHEM
jgi:hypothetical protein